LYSSLREWENKVPVYVTSKHKPWYSLFLGDYSNIVWGFRCQGDKITSNDIEENKKKN
jgi:hypothetical protein